MRVREATRDDATALAGLVTQLGYPSREEEIAARLTALPLAEHGVLAAEMDGAVAGLVHVQRLVSLVLDATAEIGALVVDEKWRGQGIGRALLKAAEDWARQKGCSQLLVRANIVRRRAHEFYFRNGFRQVKTSLTLVRRLTPEA